jgi:hypothetical protein
MGVEHTHAGLDQVKKIDREVEWCVREPAYEALGRGTHALEQARLCHCAIARRDER